MNDARSMYQLQEINHLLNPNYRNSTNWSWVTKLEAHNYLSRHDKIMTESKLWVFFFAGEKKKEKKPTHIQLLTCNSEQKDTVYPAYVSLPYRWNWKISRMCTYYFKYGMIFFMISN